MSVDLSTIQNIKFNNNGVDYFFVDDRCVWLKHNGVVYYITQTIWLEGVRYVINTLTDTNDLLVTDVTGSQRGLDLNVNGDDVELEEPANTSGYNVGQVVYVYGEQATVIGTNGNDVTYKFLNTGSTETQDGTTSTTILTNNLENVGGTFERRAEALVAFSSSCTYNITKVTLRNVTASIDFTATAIVSAVDEAAWSSDDFWDQSGVIWSYSSADTLESDISAAITFGSSVNYTIYNRFNIGTQMSVNITTTADHATEYGIYANDANWNETGIYW